MDYEKNPGIPEDDSWLDDILDAPPLDVELGPDEHAISAAGLTHPEDLELERIIEETKSSDWDRMVEGAELPERAQDAVEAPAPEQPADLVGFAMPDVFPDPMTVEPVPNDAGWESTVLENTAFDDSVFDEPVFEEPADADFFLAAAFDEPQDFTGNETRRYDTDADWVLPALNSEPEEPAEPEAPAQPEVPAEQTEKPKADVRKVRPKMKKGYGLFGIPHLLASIVWLAIILGIGVSLGRTLWVCAAEVLAFGKPDTSVTITITQADMDAEDTLDIVAAKLQYAGLIEYPELFKMYAKLTDAEEEIAPGTYTLKGTDDYMALVNSMNTHSSARETVEVMIPEGYTCAQVFALLEEKGVCAAAELEAYAANGELKDYWFLEGVERGTKYCLEGYLFPDTYEFYVGDDAGRVLTKMLGDSVGGFDVRFTDIMEEKLVSLNETLSAMMKKNGYGQEYIDAHQVTIREVVIVASMIEKETTGNDRYDIASVIYNRLTNARNYPHLNIDATILYALGGKVDPITGENQPLNEADMKLDSPYNTYLYEGLPPGPISNPGVYSLLAALDPNETAYYFYVYDPSIYAHYFSKTYEEHLRYIERMGD